jgi:hypothetical protein
LGLEDRTQRLKKVVSSPSGGAQDQVESWRLQNGRIESDPAPQEREPIQLEEHVLRLQRICLACGGTDAKFGKLEDRAAAQRQFEVGFAELDRALEGALQGARQLRAVPVQVESEQDRRHSDDR